MTIRRKKNQEPTPDVAVFLRWFPEEYRRRRHGADYLVNYGKDGARVKAMLKATSLERLQRYAQIMLSQNCEDSFIVGSDRGIGVLAVRFNWLADRYAAWVAEHGEQPTKHGQ